MYLLLASSSAGGVAAVAVAVLILLAMITVHEFGHYAIGRALGFGVEEFSIGFGPPLYRHKFRRSGQIFSVRALPLGGYCAFEGEDGEGGFNSQPPLKRVLVLVAGALFNYLAALILIAASFAAFGQTALRIDVVDYAEGYTPAESFVAGDVILGAEGRGIYLTTDLIDVLEGKREGDIAEFTVERGGSERNIGVRLRADCNFTGAADIAAVWRALGIGTFVREDGVSCFSVSTVNVRLAFTECLGRSAVYSFKIAGSIFRTLGELFSGNLAPGSVGGPVTTIKLTSQFAAQGAQGALEIAAYIGVNLAVFNLLPIPALDGSKAVLCIVELIRKKPLPRRVEAAIHTVGFACIFAFAIIADIVQFIHC